MPHEMKSRLTEIRDLDLQVEGKSLSKYARHSRNFTTGRLLLFSLYALLKVHPNCVRKKKLLGVACAVYFYFLLLGIIIGINFF